MSDSLLASIRRDLQRGGYYPELVEHVLQVALGGEHVISYLVHPETAFDHTEVYRHLTAIVLTPSRLVGVHVDDDPSQPGHPHALATSETVALEHIASVVLSHGVADPAQAGPVIVDELTITVTWGAVRRVDLEPAGCADPECDADHGFTGVVASEDLVLRVSARADGADRLAQAQEFAVALSRAVAGLRR